MAGYGVEGLGLAAVALGARVLRAVSDFEALVATGLSTRDAVGFLRQGLGVHDPSVLAVMFAILEEEALAKSREVGIRELRPGMEILDDLHTEGGILLLASGQEVTASMHQRLLNLPRAAFRENLVRVRVAT